MRKETCLCVDLARNAEQCSTKLPVRDGVMCVTVTIDNPDIAAERVFVYPVSKLTRGLKEWRVLLVESSAKAGSVSMFNPPTRF